MSEWSNFLFVPDDFIDCTANIDKYVNYELGEERREHNSNNNILWQTIFMNAICGGLSLINPEEALFRF